MQISITLHPISARMSPLTRECLSPLSLVHYSFCPTIETERQGQKSCSFQYFLTVYTRFVCMGNIPTITNKLVRIHNHPLIKSLVFELFWARVMTCFYAARRTKLGEPPFSEILSRDWTNDHKESHNFDPR